VKRRVLKFGGSNLKGASDIHKLVRAVSCYERPPVVVVSALFGITDSLVRSIEAVSQQAEGIYALIKSLMKQHQAFIDAHMAEEAERRRVLQALSQRMVELERILLGIHYLREVPPFARDQILSYGERLSSLLICELLKHYGIPCQERLPEDLGLRTDGEFASATVDIEASRETVVQGLREEIVTVIPGFYGLSPRGQVTLLGRGGTDYSAAAYAACIDAESLDIWKDVPGFMSADPKLVARPVSIERISYEEAAELSYFGAKILHPRTFEPLMIPGIPVRLYNINDFDALLEPLTLITATGVIRPGIIKSVTFTNAIGLLTLRGSGVGIRPGLLATISSVLHHARINIKSVFTSQTSINLLLDADQLEVARTLISSQKLPTLDQIGTSDGIALIAVVGEGMPDQPGIAARIFSAVSRENINIRIISSGASPVATYFIVADSDRGKAVGAIHQEFFP
jgi:aspartate kinase/aspartokinase/homoserine dehydrogenase 1